MLRQVILISLLLSGCANHINLSNSVISGNEIINADLANFEVLFIGNSHSSKNGLPDLLAILIKTGLPGKTIHVALAPGWSFLDERLKGSKTQNILTSRPWTDVILQAQKYSSTGRYWYSTEAAEEWVRRIKKQNGRPIMFPEWRRRGNSEEGKRIHILHLYIAAREAACVAPISLAWEESIGRHPSMVLHAADGNHSNLKGALLSAYVFYEVITQQSAAKLPFIEAIDVDEKIQQQLRDVASFVVNNNLPCVRLK